MRSFPFLPWLAALALLLGACAASDEPRAVAQRDVEAEPEAPSDDLAPVGPATPAPPSDPHPDARDPTVASVVDGDTFEVLIGGEVERVRVIGVNAPESGECLAVEAGTWLRDRIEGGVVTLVSDQSDRDQFGRLLRYVESDGRDVGVDLVRSGLAISRRYPPDTARADALETAQRDAQASQAGMWDPTACGTGSPSELVISEIRFDADGDDSENKNDEWVRITNAGGSDADLTGWVLKDESASHRFPFPRGFGLAAGASVTVRTGCGTSTADDLHWCNDSSAVWNNSGDTAFLLDPAGNVVDSRSG